MEIIDYRVIDYAHLNPKTDELEWRNTDPKGAPTTDGARMGQGDDDPTTEDIENSPYINVGFKDADGDWHYYWISGPFDEEFWVDEAIVEIVDEYSIVLGEESTVNE